VPGTPERMQDYHKLKVWQKAFELVDEVFRVTISYPRFIDGNLLSQIRRANIAEGCGKKGGADFLKSLRQAMGSAYEVECCIELSRNQGYLDGPVSANLLGRVIEIKKMLSGLMKSLGYDPYS
jgi:four helix bundle protein